MDTLNRGDKVYFFFSEHRTIHGTIRWIDKDAATIVDERDGTSWLVQISKIIKEEV